MKFLKAIQKAAGSVDPGARSGTDGNKKVGHTLPAVLQDANLKIGGVSSAVRTQTDVSSVPISARTVEEIGPPGDFDPAETAIKKTFPALDIIPENVNPHLVAITSPHSAYCEEYRSLRTQLLHKSREQHLQAIVIASIGPGEGKSVTALNLSWLLAQTDGLTSLVIDSDLRRPSLMQYLGLQTEMGLSKVLDGDASLEESIVELKPAGLFLLPGGESRSDVTELISGTKFKDILRQARSMFDYVIIDAPPLGVFTDAAILINEADGALLVVKANQTRYSDINRVLESLPRNRMLGTILNQSEEDSTIERYYGYDQYKGLLAG
ncbi:MAG: CpsD/CapB family tyrosine-protein kinase [Acidobacteriota bacterium]